MLRTRIIPALLLRNESLVKTNRFGAFKYVGDPCNTVRIFNELEVDELLFLDITATNEGRSPNVKLLGDISNECFMPLAYGGGIRTFEDAKEIFSIGFEKVAINSAAFDQPDLIPKLAEHFGRQAIIGSIDVRRNAFGRYNVFSKSAKHNTHKDPVRWARDLEDLGAGEILLTAVDREGTWSGFDQELVKAVSNAVNIPVVAHGGAGSISDVRRVVSDAGASAVALGSMVVFQKKDMGVLVNFPDELRNGI